MAVSVATLSNKTITVTRVTVSSDAAQTETTSTVYTGKARVQPLSGQEINLYSRDTASVTAKAYVSGTPDILPGDILTADTTTYFVHAVRDIDHLGSFTTIEMEEQR